MALDKQKILNELGSVVNQLQSADCGCMGKLFSNQSNPNNMGNPNAMGGPGKDGCMHGCCHAQGFGCHGYNAQGAGEPYSGPRHCMGSCNAPKLYADTYNYLNHNLMQPVMKEVYDDLRSITPANTIMNSPMGAKMGLTQGIDPNLAGTAATGGNMGNMAAHNPAQMPGIMGNQNANMNRSPNVHFGNTNMDNKNPNTMQMSNQQQSGQMGQMGQPMGNMAQMNGMGSQILNMMKGDSGRTANFNERGPGNSMGNTPQSPEMGSNMAGGQGQYMAGNVPAQNPGTTQYMSQQNMYAGGNAPNGQINPMTTNTNQMNPGSQAMRNVNASPGYQQMKAPNPYGEHSAGIAKFNEMFPGVMQGDLGFDPMAIAIQMNPANQQIAAMNTMQKVLNGEPLNRPRASAMQPVINATNAAAASIAQAPQPPASQVSGQNIVTPPVQQQFQQQQPLGTNAVAAPVQNNQIPQQQVHTALTGAPTMNQQQVPQQQYQGQYEQQQVVNPNAAATVRGSLPTVYEGAGDPDTRQEGYPPSGLKGSTNAQQMIMDPILPVDTSKNMPPMQPNMKQQRYYQYNTLGQPIEMVPAQNYNYPIDTNPQQTLGARPAPSKYRIDATRYSNVKNTVSKTSLMGNKPVGQVPSRSQLQHLYNQYKGSHSYTQQNIRPNENGGSYSEGHLNVAQGNAPRQVPIERVAGDTAANNYEMNKAMVNKRDQRPNQVGDVPAANYKPVAEAEMKPASVSRVRNGLQDQTYTQYTTSAAWTFHGATPAPYSSGHRFRNKV
ncbi:unnamed protein product [Chrysodeixis includens]|uniref:Uncharacterized protein n=1 Tax=Chrysodeixis includens TaxID=689277 RepID=A0A9P0BQ65_CHRIL|nr:unnamed protein product [Chrysodeixis includens]